MTNSCLWQPKCGENRNWNQNLIKIEADEYDNNRKQNWQIWRKWYPKLPQSFYGWVLVNACTNAMNSAILHLTEFLSVFTLHACAHTCVFVCVFSCFTCVHAPRGETGCVGCYLLLQRVTANHQPWQTQGERGGEREGEMTNEGEGERERRWRWAGGLAFEFHWLTTECFGSCHHNLCMGLDLSWTTAQPPTWHTDN